jgi:hypothetical protein
LIARPSGPISAMQTFQRVSSGEATGSRLSRHSNARRVPSWLAARLPKSQRPSVPQNESPRKSTGSPAGAVVAGSTGCIRIRARVRRPWSSRIGSGSIAQNVRGCST